MINGPSSCDNAPALCHDWMAELKGFEALTSAEQAPARCDGAAAFSRAIRRGARLDPTLGRRCFSCPPRGQCVERLAGLDENRRVACRGLDIGAR